MIRDTRTRGLYLIQLPRWRNCKRFPMRSKANCRILAKDLKVAVSLRVVEIAKRFVGQTILPLRVRMLVFTSATFLIGLPRSK